MENIDPKKFGLKIKNIRSDKGYSLRQVSNQSKIDDMPAISPSYWSLVERGERNIPKISTLKRMAKGLRIDESDILNLAGLSETSTSPSSQAKDAPELSENQILIAHSIDPDVSDEEREAIINMVKEAMKFRKRL